MSEIKYTTDGRKVAIVGRLNAAETIVQEIFVTKDGAELPAGENFVVKSLLDAPAKSWKETNIADLELKMKRMQKNVESEKRQLDAAYKAAKLHAVALRAFASNACAEQLAMVEMFVSGQITHLVLVKYSAPEIVPFADAVVLRDRYGDDSLRLLSLFGNSKGELSWRLHQYYDGSGSNGTVTPAKGYKEAVGICQKLYDAKVDEWIAGDGKVYPPSAEWAKNVPELVEHPGVLHDRKNRIEEARQKRIAELEKQLADIKSGEVDNRPSFL